LCHKQNLLYYCGVLLRVSDIFWGEKFLWSSPTTRTSRTELAKLVYKPFAGLASYSISPFPNPPPLRYTTVLTYDHEKNQKNINLRRLPLSLGGLVLDDMRRIERYDEEHSTPGQDRWQTIGRAGKLLFVVYMERGIMPHIISVRLAEPEERRLYYGDSDLQAADWYRVNPGRSGDA
jgi:uncharacterized DUF497 family protein